MFCFHCFTSAVDITPEMSLSSDSNDSYICPLIHNILRLSSSHVEIADSISQLVEANNSTIELYLPVDSQYSSSVETSLPVEALNLILESKPLPVELNNSTTELHLPVEAKQKRAIVESKPPLR